MALLNPHPPRQQIRVKLRQRNDSRGRNKSKATDVTCSNINLLYTNIDQPPKKRDDLLMAISDHKPDIIVLKEVIAKAQRLPIDLATISIPEYTLHVNFELNIADLGTSGKRGIGIYTRDRLSATKISFENSNFEEQLWISIRLRSQDKLLLGGIYHSLSTDITTSTKQLCSLLNSFGFTGFGVFEKCQ